MTKLGQRPEKERREGERLRKSQVVVLLSRVSKVIIEADVRGSTFPPFDLYDLSASVA